MFELGLMFELYLRPFWSLKKLFCYFFCLKICLLILFVNFCYVIFFVHFFVHFFVQIHKIFGSTFFFVLNDFDPNLH